MAAPRAATTPRPTAAPELANPLPIDSSVFFKLVRVVNLTARPFAETIGRAHQLTLNEWRVMLVLASHPGVAASDAALLTGLDKMTVSRAIARLARAGRIVKGSDPDDARRVPLMLSSKGKALFERIGGQAHKRERQLFAGVGSAEQAQLGGLLDRLIDGMLAADAAASPQRGSRERPSPRGA